MEARGHPRARVNGGLVPTGPLHREAYMRSAAKAKVVLGAAIRKAENRDHAPAVDAGIAKALSGTNAVLAYH